MTLEEAIKIMKNGRESMRRLVDDCNLSITGGHEYIEAYDMAISALEKQIPKKPKVLIDTWACPMCAEKVEYQALMGDNVLFHGVHDFCPNCGQAIDWSEEE